MLCQTLVESKPSHEQSLATIYNACTPRVQILAAILTLGFSYTFMAFLLLAIFLSYFDV